MWKWGEVVWLHHITLVTTTLQTRNEMKYYYYCYYYWTFTIIDKVGTVISYPIGGGRHTTHSNWYHLTYLWHPWLTISVTRWDQNYGSSTPIRLYWYYWWGLGETMRGWRWEITRVMPDKQMSGENTSYFIQDLTTTTNIITTSSPHNHNWQANNNPRVDDHHIFYLSEILR